MGGSKHDWMLSGTATSLQFVFLKFFSLYQKFPIHEYLLETMFYESYLTSDFHRNTDISKRVGLLVKMASKTVIRPIT